MKVLSKIKKKVIDIAQMKYLKNPKIKYIGINDSNFMKYKKFVDKNSKISYKNITKVHVQGLSGFKWVGGQYYKGTIYGIVNGSSQYLKYDIVNNTIDVSGKLKNSNFKWTGGCVYNSKIYGFPRTSNELMCINPDDGNASEININLQYKKEHHYGGVCTNDGFVFQPPRDTDHILVIDLNTLKSHRIQLVPRIFNAHLRYCGSIIHPNGLIYMFPEKDGHILVLNQKTEEFWLIGKKISTMTFDAAIGIDGNIYGFSAYECGILKIDVMNNEASMICKEIGISGAYGTKCGVNGKLYSIPGDGNHIWEFDVILQKAKPIFKLDEVGESKCAGGVVSENGSIYCIPALGNMLYKLMPDNFDEMIPNDLLKLKYFTDNY